MCRWEMSGVLDDASCIVCSITNGFNLSSLLLLLSRALGSSLPFVTSCSWFKHPPSIAFAAPFACEVSRFVRSDAPFPPSITFLICCDIFILSPGKFLQLQAPTRVPLPFPSIKLVTHSDPLVFPSAVLVTCNDPSLLPQSTASVILADPFPPQSVLSLLNNPVLYFKHTRFS